MTVAAAKALVAEQLDANGVAAYMLVARRTSESDAP